MIEIFILAGALSVELEPYAVENPEADTYRMESNTDAYGRPFQWTTNRSKSGKSLLLQPDERSGSYSDGVKRDAFGSPVESNE